MARIVCSFEPCDRHVYCKDLCQGHYNQQYKGKELTPFTRKPRSDFKPELVKHPPMCAFENCDKRIDRSGSSCGEHKRCKKCLETKLVVEFWAANEYKAHCKACLGNKPSYRQHKITKEQYEAMVVAQNGLCANPYCQSEAEVIDHDHSCCPGKLSCGKCIRGILCSFCNWAEGYLKSDPNLAIGLAEYIIMSTKQRKAGF